MRLLDRPQVDIDLGDSLDYLTDRRVLVTGAAGSIGSEICRTLLSGGSQRIYAMDHDENGLYELAQELGERIIPVLGDVTDGAFLGYIMGRLKADVVFHCAAYKHVPILEANPAVAVLNNVFGTQLVAAAAPRTVLVSTDKAVEPSSVYGHTKRIAEDIVLTSGGTVVRFGNVLDSRGSVLPMFRRQIAAGGPVTVTSPSAERYFMAIPEAAALVLKAGGVGEAGMLYTLDMGEPVNIRALALEMIGGWDIEIEYIGLRPGEKEHEKLHADDETVEYGYPKINKVTRKSREPHPILIEKLWQFCHDQGKKGGGDSVDTRYIDVSARTADRSAERFYEIIGEWS